MIRTIQKILQSMELIEKAELHKPLMDEIFEECKKHTERTSRKEIDPLEEKQRVKYKARIKPVNSL